MAPPFPSYWEGRAYEIQKARGCQEFSSSGGGGSLEEKRDRGDISLGEGFEGFDQWSPYETKRPMFTKRNCKGINPCEGESSNIFKIYGNLACTVNVRNHYETVKIIERQYETVKYKNWKGNF